MNGVRQTPSGRRKEDEPDDIFLMVVSYPVKNPVSPKVPS